MNPKVIDFLVNKRFIKEFDEYSYILSDFTKSYIQIQIHKEDEQFIKEQEDITNEELLEQNKLKLAYILGMYNQTLNVMFENNNQFIKFINLNVKEFMKSDYEDIKNYIFDKFDKTLDQAYKEFKDKYSELELLH